MAVGVFVGLAWWLAREALNEHEASLSEGGHETSASGPPGDGPGVDPAA